MRGLRNRIYCMGCMELFSKIPDGHVSLILTDPPYGIGYQNQFTRRRHSLIVGDNGIDYERFARESYRILKEDSHGYFFTRFDCYPYHFACLESAGFAVKNCLVIEKRTIGGIGDLYGSYANNGEWVLFCQKGRRVFNHTTLLQNRKKPGIGSNPESYIKPGTMPAGSGKSIRRQPIIPTGRGRTGFIIRRLRMWTVWHG